MGQGRRLSLGVLAEFILVLGLINGAIAQSNSSSCSTSALTNLAPCLPYVEAGNTSHPSSDCCSPLSSLLASDPTCLCQIAPLAKQFSISINETRALEVATLCNLTVPSSLASCLAAEASPLAAPSESPPSTSSTPMSQGGNGSHPSSDGIVFLSSPFSSVVGSVSIVVISVMLTL